MTDLISKWFNNPTTYLPTDINITHNYNLKTTLLEHQLIDVEFMYHIESRQLHDTDNGQCIIKAGVLSEPLGSGKTLIILALISRGSDITKSDIRPLYINDIVDTYIGYNSVSLKRVFKKVIKPTVVLCASNILLQWQSNIETHTYLKVYTILSVKQLRMFSELVKSDKINEYDIILVKNSYISSKITIDGYNDYPTQLRKPHIKDILRNIMINLGVACSRLVYDDFDMMMIDSRAPIPTYFTWFVSSSYYSNKPVISSRKYSPATPLSIVLDYDFYNSHMIRNSDKLWKLRKVQCPPDFTNFCIKPSKLKFYQYDFISNISIMATIIGQLSSNEVRDMVMSDALKSAAHYTNSKHPNVGSIIRTLLNNNYEEWDKLTKFIKFVDNIFNSNLETDNEYIYNIDTDELVFPDKINQSIVDELTILKDEATEKKEKIGVALDRVKERLCELDCNICTLPLAEDKCVIYACCGFITCVGCCVNGCRFNKDKGTCIYCRSDLTIKELVLVSPIDFDNIRQENTDAKVEISFTHPVSKIDIILELITNHNTSYERDIITPDIYNLLTGDTILPEPTDSERRYLICGQYDETVNMVYETIKHKNIKVDKLMGNVHGQRIILNNFKKGIINVLIIGNEHFAGLDLSYVTDLIFMQTIYNIEISKQVIGRIQRYGRVNQGTVHFMNYNKANRESSSTR